MTAKIKTYNWALMALLISVILRLVIYLQNRNLFLDEISVALNVCQRSWFDLFHSLDYQQHFPPLSLVLIKWITDVLGIYDWSLRLLPLLASLISLYFFYLLARDRIKMAWFPILVFGCTLFTLRYQTELKQYSVDILASVIYLAILYKAKLKSSRFFYLLLAFCALAPWFSMPSIFMVVALLFYTLLSKQISKAKILVLVVTSGISFLLLYLLCLKPSLSSDHLLDFHTSYFMKMEFSAWGDNFRMLENFIGAFLGSTALTVGSALVLLIAGFIKMKNSDPNKLISILLVFLLTLSASFLQKYSMSPRLLCFWFPLVVWIMGNGADLLMRVLNKVSIKPVALVLFLGLFAFPNLFYKQAISHLWQPYVIEQPRELLEKISSEIEAEHELWLTQFGTTSFKYYTECHSNPILIGIDKIIEFSQPESDAAIISRLNNSSNKHIWIFDSHKNSKLESFLKTNYPKCQWFETPECFAVLINNSCYSEERN